MNATSILAGSLETKRAENLPEIGDGRVKDETTGASVEPIPEVSDEVFVGIPASILAQSPLPLEASRLLILAGPSFVLDLLEPSFFGLNPSLFVPRHGAEVADGPSDGGVAFSDEFAMACLERVFKGTLRESEHVLAKCG